MEKERNWFRVQVAANWVVAFFAAVTSLVGYQQYRILKEANRPSVIAVFNGSKIVSPQVGHKIGSELLLMNSGKTAAAAEIRSAIFYSLEQLDAPLLPDTKVRLLVWNTGQAVLPIEGSQEITEGQLRDMRSGRGYLYFSAYIRYGRDGQYYSAICTEHKLRPTAEGTPLIVWDEAAFCQSPTSNSTD